MSKTPKYDAKVKAILDATEPGKRVCALSGQKWEMTEREIGWYKKFNVPPSKYSPLTRWRLMTAFFCGWQWWYNKHAETGEPVLSYIHPASGYKVLPDKEWHNRDFSVINTRYNPEQPFFEQFDEFNKQIPQAASKDVKESFNSLSVVSLGDEDSFFVLAGNTKRSINCSCAKDTEDSAEIYWSTKVQTSYNIVNSHRIHNCKYLRECFDCMNSSFLFDCRDCEDCFGAVNRRRKKYLWFNKQLTEEEYKKRIVAVDLSCRNQLDQYINRFKELIEKEGVWPENFNDAVENCTGEYLEGCTDLEMCFACNPRSRNLFYCTFVHGASNDCAFCCGPNLSNYCYYSIPSECSHAFFCYETFKCTNVEYCMNCMNCDYCFACSGLQRKKYCIFNQQYSEEEYWEKLDEIKCNLLDRDEYGEYFPARYAPGYFPDAGALVFDGQDMGKIFGALEYDPESMGAIGERLADTSRMRQVSEVPDCINEMDPDEWTGVPVFDPSVNRRFAYVRPEIEFYKTNQIAPPKIHFIPRVKQLYWEGNIGVFQNGECAECGKKIMFAENRTYRNRKILCKPCYLEYLEKYG